MIQGFYNSDAVRGDGIWKTTDGGTTWTQLASTSGQLNFQYVNRLAIHSGTGAIIAATRANTLTSGGGIRSVDGGITWTRTLGWGGSPFWAGDVQVAANGDVYAATGVGFSGDLYKSTDGGATWSMILSAGVGETRMEIALAPSNANYVYVLIAGTGGGIGRVMRSTDAGSNWTDITPGAVWEDQCSGTPVSDFTRGQAWYDLCAAVDPNDPNRIFIGGIDILLSDDAGASWTQVTKWSDCDAIEDMHADQHVLRFAPGSSSVLYAGNDGGIYRSENADTSTPTFQTKEHGYSTAQFYSCAMHPDAGSAHFLAGAQDNGSHRFDELGGNEYTVEVTGGDGAFCHIDQDEPQYQWTSYVYQNFRRSTDGGQTFTNVNVGSNGLFINPSDYDNTGNYMYASSSGGNYLLWSDPKTGTTFSNVSVADFGGYTVSAVTASPNTPERVWFGLYGSRVVRVDNAASSPSSTNITGGSFPASGTVSCIAVEPGDDAHLLVTFFNYGVTSVWETTDGGTNWTAVEGNLPDMPVRWALFNPLDATQAVIATELGVWSTTLLNGASTDWQPSNTGLANVRVDMLQHRASDNLILAATHGRGLYSSPVFTSVTAEFEAERTRWFANRSLQFHDRSYQATSWNWDFGDAGFSTAQNPTHTYANPGTYTVTLTINGGADAETKVSYLAILDEPDLPYLADFNTHDNGFYAYSLSDGDKSWEWGQSSSSNFNAGNSAATVEGAGSWATDLDDNHGWTERYALESPPFDLTTGSGNYTLEFSYRMAAGSYSGMNLEYSIDGGQSWDVLGAVGDPLASNWYTNTSIQGLDNRPGWYKSSFSVFNPTYEIDALQGNSDVRFRFVYGASYWANDGAQVDGFTVYDDFVVLEAEVESEPALPEPERELAIRAFPNPVRDRLTLTTGFLEPGSSLLLRLYHTSGKRVWQRSMEVPAAGEIGLPLAGLARGLYLLEIISPGQQQVERIWKE